MREMRVDRQRGDRIKGENSLLDVETRCFKNISISQSVFL